MLPKAKHWKSLFQHLVTYPIVKAFVVALAISILNIGREWLKTLNAGELFLGTFAIAWIGYFISYSLKSKRYHFYEVGQFNYIHSQNVRLLRVSKGRSPFGQRLEFQVDFFDEMPLVPTFKIEGVKSFQRFSVTTGDLSRHPLYLSWKLVTNFRRLSCRRSQPFRLLTCLKYETLDK